MPPSLNTQALNLHILPQTFFLVQLTPGESIPQSILDKLVSDKETQFVSITRTSEEISIIFDHNIDADGPKLKATTWRCIKVQGPMDFSLTGIMNDLTLPLKIASVSIFAISTWNTDWILVPHDKISEAVKALRSDGWTIIGGTDELMEST